MSGIYGDVLLCFCEQFKDFEVFEMKAHINGGWDKNAQSIKKIKGVLHHTGAKTIKENAGNLTYSSGYELWTLSKELEGMFITVNKDTYRIKSVNDWNCGGGFFKYSLEKVIGDDGTKSSGIAWNTGRNSFS